jgi:hypothetical protein
MKLSIPPFLPGATVAFVDPNDETVIRITTVAFVNFNRVGKFWEYYLNEFLFHGGFVGKQLYPMREGFFEI